MSDDAELSDEVLSETRAWLATQDQGKPQARTTRKSAR